MLFRLPCSAVIAAAAVMPLLSAADLALVRLLPENPSFVAGVNATQVRDSRFGQFVLDQLKSEEANLEAFIASTGFDPRRDLTELVVVSQEPDPRSRSLVLARGRFDAARIQDFADRHGAKTVQYRGFTALVHGPADDGGTWFVILDPSTAVAGDAGLVCGAVDRFRGVAPAAAGQGLLDRVAALSARYDAWMIASGLERIADGIGDPQLGNVMAGNLAQSMRSVSGGVRFGAKVELMAEAVMRSEKDASAMVDVIRFLGGMIQLNRQPADKSDPRAAELLSLLDQMELKATGNQFCLSLILPEQVLEQMVRPASRRKPSPVI